MSKPQTTRDGRSHRLVTLIGVTNPAGQKCLLTLKDSSTLFPGTVFGADDRSTAAFHQARGRALNELLTQLGLPPLNMVINHQIIEADTPRQGGGHKQYLLATIRWQTIRPKCQLVAMPIDDVVERLTAQEDEGRCSGPFIDRVLDAIGLISGHAVPVAA